MIRATYQNCHSCLQACTGPHIPAHCCVQAAIEAEQGLLAAANAPGKCNERSLADHVLGDLLAASAEGGLPGRLYGKHIYILAECDARQLSDMMLSFHNPRQCWLFEYSQMVVISESRAPDKPRPCLLASHGSRSQCSPERAVQPGTCPSNDASHSRTMAFFWRMPTSVANAQASCLVVDTRAAAEEVLRAFEARRAGIVTCKIAAEHNQDRCRGRLVAFLLPIPLCQPVSDVGMCKHSHVPLPAAAGLEALLAHVEVAPDASGAQCIFNTMLGSWLMARDRTSVPPLCQAGLLLMGLRITCTVPWVCVLPCRRRQGKCAAEGTGAAAPFHDQRRYSAGILLYDLLCTALAQ